MDYSNVSTLNTVLLVIAALLPAVVLCIYVFIKDRVEKEPFGLLALLLFSGVVIIIPLLIASAPFIAIHEAIFSVIPSNAITDRLFYATDAFFNVALFEEGFKWLALILITKNNKNFNSLFDGIIYAVFISLGFAGAENILYCLQNGWATAIMRAVLAVPGHMFDAVFMGYFYSLWHMNSKARTLEKSLVASGHLPQGSNKFASNKYAVLSLVVPILAHGLYDYCCFVGSVLSTLALYAFVIFLYIYCFKKIKQMSKDDVEDVLFVKHLMVKEYPQLKSHLFATADEYAGEQTQTAEVE